MTAAFITFEGGEGSGKSTQIRHVYEALRIAGLPCLMTREPGGTPQAERIRELLVSGDKNAWDAAAETLLFYAARMEHVNRRIKPALAEGATVLCDRFADSTRVYQGIGKGVPDDFIRHLHTAVLGDFAPTLTMIFDIDPETGLKRAASRQGGEMRFESLGLEFHRKVREGFLAVAREEPGRCAVIDASADEDTVRAQVAEAIRTRTGLPV